MSRVWVVCYDIADDRRRAAVAETLEGRGRRVQDSVFEIVADRVGITELRVALGALCDWGEDSLRCYPLCAYCQADASRHGSGGETAIGDFVLI